MDKYPGVHYKGKKTCLVQFHILTVSLVIIKNIYVKLLKIK